MTLHRAHRRDLAAGFLLALMLTLAGAAPGLAGCYGSDGASRQTRFVVRAGEVEHKASGLIWKRCSVGLDWDGKTDGKADGKGGCVGEIAYLGLDEAIASAGGEWRVPSGPDLESLVDTGCGSPVVDSSVFPDIRADDEGHAKYWTTNALGMLDLYWNFDFIDGHPDGNSHGVRLAVRLVRGGRPPAPK